MVSSGPKFPVASAVAKPTFSVTFLFGSTWAALGQHSVFFVGLKAYRFTQVPPTA